MKSKLNINHINRWFAFFISIHVFFWTLLPSVFRYNLPMDALEGAIWGRHFSLGYDKNPFMNGWLTGLAVHVSGTQGWTIYLLGQLSVAVCFIALYHFARKLTSPTYAFIAVFLLAFMTSYNLDAIDFDDNVLELALWMLTILFFYSAVFDQKIRDWIYAGIFAGLSVMTKYYAAVLFLPMFLFLLMHSRKTFSQAGLYLAVGVATLISLPHFIWLFYHDFVTVHYAFGRVNDGHLTVWSHFLYPYKFVMPYLETCILPLLLFGSLYLGKKTWILRSSGGVTRAQWQFLLWMGFGPFVITVLLSLIFGWVLNAGWGQPLLTLWPLMLVIAWQPAVTPQRFYRFVAIGFFLLIVFWVGYAVSMWRAGDSSSAHYPGQKMAAGVTALWHQKYHTKLSYVMGLRFEAGNVAFYSEDKPQVYIDADSVKSFWINQKDLKRKGAVFVWDVERENFSGEMHARFPQLIDQPQQKFCYYKSDCASPVKLGIAFLPPRP